MTLPRLFPTLMPGETIHSAVSRYHQLVGNVSASTSLTELFGNRATWIASDFPSGLGQFLTLPGNTRIVEEHTLLPLFSPFFGEARTELVRSHMLGKAGKSVKFACGVMNAGFERYRAWRYCPECMLEDSLKHGVAYWHVIHQAVGVLACSEHRVPLYTLSIYGKPLGQSPLILPGSTEIQASASQFRFNSAQLVNAVNVTKLINWGLAHPVEVAQLLSRNFLKFILHAKGLVHRNRTKALLLQQQVENALQDYPPYDEFQRLGALCQRCPPWVLGMIKRQDRTHHPLFYFALLSLLAVSVSDLDKFIHGDEMLDDWPSASVAGAGVSQKVSKELIEQKRIQFCAVTKEGGFKKAKEYSWLYRNDRQWLKAYVRSHPFKVRHQGAVDWTARDQWLSHEIQRAKAELLSYLGKPVKITQRSLARYLCLPLSYWRRIELLPKSAEAILQAEESSHDFQMRCVAWASRALTDGSILRTRYSLLRRAGIRVLLLTEEELNEWFD